MKQTLRNKHLRLDQKKIDAVKKYFGVATEQEAIDRALSLVVQEQKIVKGLQKLKRVLRDDKGPWPYL